MKKLIFTLGILLISLAAAFANHGKRGILKIRLSNNAPLTVVIDGRNYDRHGRSITIGDLPRGRHYVKVYSYREYKAGGGHAKLIYAGNIKVVKDAITSCVINPERGTAKVHIMEMDDSYADDNNHNNRNDNDVYNKRERVLDQGDMTDLKERVNDRITDTDKLKLMKSVLADRTYYTDQVKTMMSWLSFESSRLDLAKSTYSNTIDKQDYWKLESELTFSSSKDELNDFISKNK